MLWWSIPASLIAGFVLCAASTALVRRVGLRRGFVDHPGGHKRHTVAVALGGGIAITAAVVLPVVVGFVGLHLLAGAGTTPSWFPVAFSAHVDGLLSKARPALALVAGAVVLHGLGLVDDRRSLSPWTKLAVQAGVAVTLVVVFDLRLLTRLGPALSIVLSVLWIVGITNAFNLLDNMDGLCAGVGAITATVLAFTAARAGQLFVPTLATLIVGVLLGFLRYNFPPARIFMGDAGSLVVGYWLAMLTILTTYMNPDTASHPSAVLMPVVILAVPLYDTLSVVVLRLRRGISPFRGDQRHFSHRLVQRGLSPRSAVLTIYLATLATSIGAAHLPHADWVDAVMVGVQCAGVVAMIAILESAGARAEHSGGHDA